MSIATSDLLAHYRLRQRQAEECIAAYEQLSNESQAISRHIEEEIRAAHLALARAYLHELTPEAAARVERLTGFRLLSRFDPFKAMSHERTVLEHTIARIRADERYTQRELLTGPDSAIAQELDQAREMLATFDAECRKFEDLDGFIELVYIGYDTPHYTESWWQAGYWKSWARGDRICQELGMKDFGDDVLPAYRKHAEPRDFWRAEMARLEGRLAEIHELVKEHDQAVARIPSLPALYLEQTQNLLAEYLIMADLPLLDEWMRNEPEDRGVRMALRAAAGARAKKQFLGEMTAGLDQVVHSLHDRTTKYQRKVTKFSRPKYSWRSHSERLLDSSFDSKYQKLLQDRAKLQSTLARLRHYDDYSRFDLQNDSELWWHEFVGKIPPRIMPRLRRYFEHHPEVRPVYVDLDLHHSIGNFRDAQETAMATAVAQAAVSRELDDIGYLS